VTDALGAFDVLVLTADAGHAAVLRNALGRAGGEMRIAFESRLAGALATLARRPHACVVIDVALPDTDGPAIVRALREARPGLPVIVASRGGSEHQAARFVGLGVADYVPPGAGAAAELSAAVRAVLGRAVLAAVDETSDRVASASDTPPDQRFVVATPAMHAVLGLIARAAGSTVPVLIEGETGTGKELVARAVHERGPRRSAPFLVQNCAALPEALLESELFGHVRGAFTGADRDRRGLFDEAEDGTVFLDEIGDAPPTVQAKLLRVLQGGETKPLGADRVRRVRARVVAATNRALENEVEAGRFRADLYYRLSVFPIHLPPLRRRPHDVAPLSAAFLARYELLERRETGGFDADALRLLQAYGWPGNVRELENEVHRLVLSVSRGERLRPRHLSRRIRDATVESADVPLDRLLARVELAVIRQRLAEKATKRAAAESLGITREALYAKMRRLGLTGPRA
jgi:DNA-binding NtrC family response regulator